MTVLGIAPSAARGLRARSDGACPAADLSSLRAFASTGEAWDDPTWHWLFETVGDKRLPILNYSGGTETGGGILSCYTIAPIAPASFAGPLPGMDVDVLDAEGEPTSEIGELVVRNTWVGMTHSFWRDDERYLDTYWSRWPDTWVHGDLASIDADGYWHIHGRSDDTLKIGGRRVGPSEIESALVAQPGIAEAAVIGVPDEMKGQQCRRLRGGASGRRTAAGRCADRRCHASCWARRWRRHRWSWSRACPRPRTARSCAARSARATSAKSSATCPPTTR